MPAKITSGFFPVADLPAAQLVKLRVYVTNLETKPGHAVVEVYRQGQGSVKELVVRREIDVPGSETLMIEVPPEEIEGRHAEVTIEVPTDGGFIPPDTGLRTGVAVVTEFTVDQSISLLQWISAHDFVMLPQ